MNQPCSVVQPPPPEPLPSRDIPAMWFWLALLVAVAIFELWAYKSNHSTLSQLLKGRTGRVLKWIGLAGFALLGFHLFFGGPL